MDRYTDRLHAGKVLADNLLDYQNRDDVIVLALPRGGVPVGYEIAKTLHAPLDVFIVRKLGVPGHSELAMGALATGGACVFNESIIRDLSIPQYAIEGVIEEEKKELKRRETVYRGNKAFPDLKNKIVILVDDGIATGASIKAAIKALDQLQPKSIVVAVPVADKYICSEIELSVDQMICPLQTNNLQAVGLWYHDFSQTEDEEVHAYLRASQESS
jgi:putative phosphoribosyl transferase